MQEKAFRNPKIHFIWNSAIQEIVGEKTVTGVELIDLVNGVNSKFKQMEFLSRLDMSQIQKFLENICIAIPMDI